MADDKPLGLFEAFGVELEYMIVSTPGLDVLPICDRVLEAQTGEITSDAEYDGLGWSNELALHVIELKTDAPSPRLGPLPAMFASSVRRINDLLTPMGGRLLPTAMHPWMDPHAQMKIWPHDYSPVYQTFNRIFDCRGHGWANLQSAHINLPFADDEQFGRLHAAIRFLLPILPALAASSPVMDGRVTGVMDNRLAVYKTNARKVPSVSGRVIPEPVYTHDDYQRKILHRIYDDLAPYDAEGVLRYEWANARGAIARFDRNAIEIRVLDVQECPAADLAIAALIVGVLKLLAAEQWSDLKHLQSWAVDPLADLLDQAIGQADRAVIANGDYLRALGYTRGGSCTTAQLWAHLIDEVVRLDHDAIDFAQKPLGTLMEHGPLSRRIIAALGPSPTADRMTAVYGQLADCLQHNEVFFVP